MPEESSLVLQKENTSQCTALVRHGYHSFDAVTCGITES